MTPSARSLAHLRDQGYHPEVVEKWIPQARIRRDLFGFIDILAMNEMGDVIAVQATSADNVSARLKKIADNPMLPWVRKAGWRILVHGWRRPTKTRREWTLRIEDVS